MNKLKVYRELLNVRGHLLDIEAKSDTPDYLDDVTAAQYGVLDTMATIIDELIAIIGCACYERSRPVENELTEEIEPQYITGEDKTVVWRRLYLNGDCIVEELTGWYHGEPNEQSTKEYSNSMHTAYFTP